MKIAYVDCFSGISGDMFLGALVDAGVPLAHIEKELRKLKLKGYALGKKKVVRAGLAATKVDVIITAKGKGQEAKGRKWKDIQEIITDSRLPEKIKKQGFGIFRTLFEAEAKIHGKTLHTTHLHELGAIDCLVDIFGTLTGLSYFGIEKVYASPVNLGSGRTKTSHGMMPVPVPATTEILKNIPCFAEGPAFEKTTPTGAVILKTLATGFGPMPLFRADAIGTGAGDADPDGWPNVLRIMIGETYQGARDETVTVIETNIDDMNPQVYEYVMERLLDHGALEVYLTPVIMKKSRPGTLLSVLCSADKKNELLDIIFKETTTIGMRFHNVGRVTMKREMGQVQTRYGRVRVKVSSFGDSITRDMPEYEDCRRLALDAKVPLTEIMKEVSGSARQNKGLSRKKAGGR